MKTWKLGMLVSCGMTLAIAVWAADVQTMSVQVQSGELRDTPSFLGTVVATLNYGDRVQVLEQRGAWLRASKPDGSGQGWIHSSALTRNKIELKAGDAVGSGASSGEIALAGKGFNEQVEASYKTGNKNLDYTWVDKMESVKIPSRKLMEFLKDGGVTPRGGAR